MTDECRLIFDDFQNSVKRMKEGLKKHKSIIVRDACIKRFEITFELSWKLLKIFLGNQGFVCNSPKLCLQQAFSFGLIDDNPLWVDMLNDRNYSVHTYSEKFADALYDKLNGYIKLFQELEKGVKQYY